MIVHEYEGAFQTNGNNVLKKEWKYKLLNTHIPYTNKRNREAAFAAARKALHLGRHTFTLLLWDRTTGVYTPVSTDW